MALIDNITNNLVGVIMCGGSGTRLWPLSRESYPKQFLKIQGNKWNMFQLSVLRLIKLNLKKLIIISSKKIEFLIEKSLKEINVENYLLINEPFKKDTTAAICVCSQVCDINDTIIFISADHIWNDEKFKECVEKGTLFVEKQFVFFGIKPNYPETGFGYIEIDKNNNVVRFTEKPDSETAVKFLKGNNYFWNSGNFLINNKNLQYEFLNHTPIIFQQIKKTIDNSNKADNVLNLNPEYFKDIESISIDFSIMEKNKNGKCIIYDSLWSDIGSHKSMYDNTEKDSNNSNIIENLYLQNCNNCFFQSENKDKIIAGIDLGNTCIVDTDDALLICNLTSTQKIKDIIQKIKTKNKKVLEYHNLVFRPWGWYKNIEGNDNSGYKVKRICVYPGKRLSLQSHKKRSEHWVIIKGVANVQVGEDNHILNQNQHVYIPIGVLHRLENKTNEMVELIETQIGSYLGEDDIIRYQDDFGRC